MDEEYMQKCLDLAIKGLGNVAPNPLVGAILVHQGEIIGSGYHQQFGGPHAEVNAINSVQNPDLLKESTLYVNLEPCSHFGKTPPCADLIIEKKIPEVVIANKDPFPKVSGSGIAKLEQAGVRVRLGVKEKDAWWLNRRFFTFHTEKRPYVFLKWAQTNDGYMDAVRMDRYDSPLRISSEESLIMSHQLRATESAILIGTQTALLDNPSLTVRKVKGNHPVRILIDRKLKVPFHYNLYNGESKTYVFTEKIPHLKFPNVEFIPFPFEGNGYLSIPELLKVLYEMGLQSIIVEGGALLLNSFINSGFWDEIRKETNRQLIIKRGVEAPQPQGFLYKTERFANQEIIYYRKNN